MGCLGLSVGWLEWVHGVARREDQQVPNPLGEIVRNQVDTFSTFGRGDQVD